MKNTKSTLLALVLLTPVAIIAQNYAPATDGTDIAVYPEDNSSYSNIQSECHISVDRNNPNNIILSTNSYDYSLPLESSHQQGYYYSNDGGLTWSGSDDFPNAPTFTVNPGYGTTYTTTEVGGDPSTAIDANGNEYIADVSV